MMPAVLAASLEPVVGDEFETPSISMNMNVPNSLTILRILLIPVYVGLLNYEQFDYALATLFIAGLTDALDGTIARVANQRTQTRGSAGPFGGQAHAHDWIHYAVGDASGAALDHHSWWPAET